MLAARADGDVDESRRAIDALHEMGIEVAMLTGDSEEVARAVAEELGIDQYFAEVLPEEKDPKVAQLQSEGKLVAMVGKPYLGETSISRLPTRHSAVAAGMSR